MKIENVGQSLNLYFQENRLFKVLLPLDKAIVYVAAVCCLVFTIFSAGVVATAVYYIGIIGWLLAFSKSNYIVLAIGFAAEALQSAYSVIVSLVKYQSFNLGSLLVFAIFGYLAYLAYRKSLLLSK